MAAIATSTLLSEAKCYLCAGITLVEALKLALLARILLAADPAADTSFSALVEYGKCYTCYGASLYDVLELALLDQISQA